jgi:hypothetical protein
MQSAIRALVVTILVCAGPFSAGALAATITGKVVDTANRPVASAIVGISEVPTSLSNPPAWHGTSTRTAADGTFSFTNLEAATYLLCSQVPRGNLLSPCQWTTARPHVTVASATATTSITLTMRPGYRLPIRVDDPQGLLNAHEGKTAGAHLLIGVHGGYQFEAADIDSNDNSGRNVSILVPFDAPVTVSVFSKFFKLQDSVGNAMNKSTAVPVNVSSAAPSSKLNIKVIGNN